MATKNNRETMIQFINENQGMYNGQTDLNTLHELPDETVQKVYRAIKTKLWSQGRKKPRTMADRIEATQTYDECVELKAEVESYLPLIEERIATLKAAKIESLKASINDSKSLLKELQG